MMSLRDQLEAAQLALATVTATKDELASAMAVKDEELASAMASAMAVKDEEMASAMALKDEELKAMAAKLASFEERSK